MWQHRPHPRTPVSESALLQTFTSLLSELNVNKYLHFQLTMTFVAEKCTQLILSGTNTTLTYICLCRCLRLNVYFPQK